MANAYAFPLISDKIFHRPSDLAIMDRYKQFQNLFDQAIKGQIPREVIIHHKLSAYDRSQSFKGPIRILMDADCGSSCESAISFFESLPNSKTVGEKMAGSVHFGNTGALWLRNSNILVQLATQHHEFADLRFVEKIGWTPQIPVRAGFDAMDTALEGIADTLKR